MPIAAFPARQRTSCVRPCLEALEDRLLLAAVPLTLSAASGSIQGIVYTDRNADGQRQAGEAGLAGRTVFLDRNSNGRLDAGEPSTVSAADGSYRFPGLPAGTFVVQLLAPPGWQVTRQSVTATAVQSSTADRLIRLDRFRADPRFAGIDGRGFSVAVLDTGIDAGHRFFGSDADRNGIADAIVVQRDFVANDFVAEDFDGHGTHITSLIASRDRTYPGIAPGVNVIVLKVLDGAGNGSFASVQRALRWVLNNASTYRIAAVNLSLGDGGYYTGAVNLHGIGGELAALAAANVPVLAAAGNEHGPGGPRAGVTYPAADRNVITVGAVWDSNQGGDWEWGNGAVDLTTGPDRIMSFSQRAPGVREIFAPGSLLTAAAPGNETSTLSGTSVATAVASGVVVLAQQLASQRLGRLLSTAEIRSLLETTGRIIRDGDDERDNVPNTAAAYRRIDVQALGEAILALGSASPGPRAGSLKVLLPAGKTVSSVHLGSRTSAANHAPGLTGSGRMTRGAGWVPSRRGDRVSDLLNTSVRDVDPGSAVGLAVVATVGLGRWQRSSDGGLTWSDLGAVPAGFARLLADTDRLRFVPAQGWRGIARVEYRAWDQTSGVPGGLVDLRGRGRTGGTSAFSVEVASATLRVGGVWVSRTAPLTVGVTLAVLNRPLAAGKGISIVGVSGNGRWQYTLDGRSWLDLGAVGPRNARLLPATARLRFLPAVAGAIGKVSYRIWNGVGAAGSLVDPLRADLARRFEALVWTLDWSA